MAGPITGIQHISKDFFLAMFDEFTSVPTPKIEAYISLASMRISPTAWGAPGRTVYQMATGFLAAHMLVSGGGKAGSQSGSGGVAGGPLTQEAVGDLSRSFGTVGTPGTGKETYMTTRYGQIFVELMRENVVGYMATGRPPVSAGSLVLDDETIG